MRRISKVKPACPFRAIAEEAKRLEFRAYALFNLTADAGDVAANVHRSLQVVLLQLRQAQADAFLLAEPEEAK